MTSLIYVVGMPIILALILHMVYKAVSIKWS